MPDDLLIALLLFVLSLTVLIKASDVFTDAAEKLGLLMGLPAFIIGVTIVSLGTSIPELISSIIAVTEGASEIVIGNVVGSNIANICLVLGTASVVSSKSMQISYDLLSVDLPLFTGSTFLLVLMVWDQEFTTGEAVLLLVGYCVYLFYTLKSSEEDTAPTAAIPDDAEVSSTASIADKEKSTYMLRQIVLLIASALFIFIGARFTINSLIAISDIISIGREIIAVSAVALGTSLPELIVTANAARRGRAEIAIGNVLGSNIFNIFMVMGIPGVMGTLVIPSAILATGIPTLIATTILMFFVTQDRKLTVWEGWLFFIIYFWFVAHTFNWV